MDESAIGAVLPYEVTGTGDQLVATLLPIIMDRNTGLPFRNEAGGSAAGSKCSAV